MKAIFKISYYLRSNYKNKGGKCPVMIRISLNGKMCNVGSSGLSIIPEQWSTKFSRMKGKTSEALIFNNQLDGISNSLNNLFSKVKDDEFITTEKIKSLFIHGSQTSMTFIELFEKFNSDFALLVNKTKSPATLAKYERTKKYFILFLKKRYTRNDISLNDINYTVLCDFELFLKTDLNCSHNTTAKYLKYIKTIIILAQKKGLINYDPFLNYNISLKKVDRGYLTSEEVKLLLRKKIDIQRLEIVRDVFVFSCFTGLSYIDVYNLTIENIHEINSQKWIVINRQKTNVQSNVLLLEIPLQIIDKYKGKTKNNKLLPILSNQKMNSYLKEIADICKIKKNLTYHLARHTFATTITLEKGVPIESVSKMLGHTNIKTTQIYARVTKQKIENDMKNLSSQLSGFQFR